MDQRQYAPATERNRDVIADVLLPLIPANGNILEIASGTGEHGFYLAPRIAPQLWLPSDPHPLCRASICAWRDHYEGDNFLEPLNLDVQSSPWPIESNAPSQAIAAIVAINLIHISPWSACLGLLAGAERILPAGSILYLYGPYRQANKPTAPSNEAFDQYLKSQNADWGLRELEKVLAEAQKRGLDPKKVVEMPANNLSVVFERRSHV